MSTEISEAVAAMIVESGRARETAWAAKRAEKAEIRAERKAARDWGLRRRHARKLARNQPNPSIT